MKSAFPPRAPLPGRSRSMHTPCPDFGTVLLEVAGATATSLGAIGAQERGVRGMAVNAGLPDSWQQLIGTDRAGVDGNAEEPAGGGRLKHSHGPWARAAATADQLKTSLGQVKSELAAAHQGVAAGSGLEAVAVLRAVRTSWERRIASAADECGRLAVSLRTVARTQGKSEDAVRASLATVCANAGTDAR
jgi:hypothetical protein